MDKGFRMGMPQFHKLTTQHIAAALIVAFAAVPSAHAVGPVVALERVSIASDGSQAMADSFSSAISADGRFVAFDTGDPNLDPAATRARGGRSPAPASGFPYYVYVRNRPLGTTELISVTPSGQAGNGWAMGPAISADGRYVAFTSFASNLVAGDTNGFADVFVRDRTLGTTVRASVAGDGPDIGGGGFGNNANYLMPTWFSANGRYVLFGSNARLTANDTNGTTHLFRRDLLAGVTELVSVNPAGFGVDNVNAGGAMSADGRVIMFASSSTDIITGADPFGRQNLYVRDMLPGVTTSLTPNLSTPDLCWGGSGDNHSYNLSSNGRFAVFNSYCDDIAPGQDIQDTLFVRDLVLGATSVLRLTDNGALDPRGGAYLNISASGRDVVAWTDSTQIGAGDTDNFADVFVRDRIGAHTFRISQRADGTPANASSLAPSASGAGHIVFASDASNLVDGDSNGYRDIFVATLDTVFAGGFE
jgi:WD40-like Beta Propeller Repeat